MSTRHLSVIACVIVALALVVLPKARSADATGAPIEAHGSVEQVDARGLAPGHRISLVDNDGSTVGTRVVNDLGGVLFREVDPAIGYQLVDEDTGSTSNPVVVHDQTPAPWNPEIYDQPIAPEGYQYLTTRDGTQLAIAVRLPTGKTVNDAPFPTLIEYAGYGYADPSGPQSGLAQVANLMGFAVVDVNMRGTGCSGGAFDYFEMLQNLDAYDVIETIARQPWVLNGQVGMFGISYGGISQLFAAQLNPPHLAAIAPMSVIDATPTTLYPGGILNTGFAMSWAKGRVDDAQPATADTGQKWAYKRIQDGDTTCAANQALHLEAVDLLAKIASNSHYTPEVADPLDPVSFVHKIRIPTFLACQFQDEQTGGHCPELVRHFTGTPDKWFTFTNGAHIDALDPATLNQIFDFLQVFVAEQAPGPNVGLLKAVAPLVYQTALGVPDDTNITLPYDPIQHESTYAGALAALRELPRVQIRFDNGAGASPTGDRTPGNPYAGYTVGFDDLPAPGTENRTWFFNDNGSLTTHSPSTDATDTYTSDPAAVPRTDYLGDTGGGGLWSNAADWEWNWLNIPKANAVSYVSEPLTADTTVLGTGAVKVWVRSSTPELGLQATISEVRPDGYESFVQNGWLRASARKLSTDSNNMFKRPSTPADPIPSFLQADAAPMPADEFVPVTIPLYYQGHAYRAGSRIRVEVSAPGGSQPVWEFGDADADQTTTRVAIAYGPSMPSSLILPTVPGVDVPTELPACHALRNEPCRTYEKAQSDPVTHPTTTTPPTSTTSVPATATPVTTQPAAPSDTARRATGTLPATGARIWMLSGIGIMLAITGVGIERRVRFRHRTD